MWTHHLIYADDSTLGATGKTEEDLENKLNDDMEQVDTWGESNRMATNCDKSKVMLITTYQKETKLDCTHTKVTCQNIELENVNSHYPESICMYQIESCVSRRAVQTYTTA